MSEDKNIKDRFWVAIIYPESMVIPVDQWDDVIQKPYVYCLHDKDKDGHNGDRKAHYHLVVAWNNNTTYNAAFNLFKEIMPSLSKIERVKDIKYMYDYLIHDTKSCKETNKHLYSVDERISRNNFDIAIYENVSLEQKRGIRIELTAFLRKKKFTTYTDFYFAVLDSFDDGCYEDVACVYNGFFSNLCKGFYHKKIERETRVTKRVTSNF